MIRVTCFGGSPSRELERYISRLQKLTRIEWQVIPIRSQPSSRPQALLPEEAKFLKTVDSFTLLDRKGKQMDSEELSEWFFRSSHRHLVVGPAVGFHSDFYERASEKISLSQLTLTHALAQLMLAESLYRSLCIRSNHPFAK